MTAKTDRTFNGLGVSPDLAAAAEEARRAVEHLDGRSQVEPAGTDDSLTALMIAIQDGLEERGTA